VRWWTAGARALDLPGRSWHAIAQVHVVAQLTIRDRERHRRDTAGWERDEVILRSFADRSADEAWASSQRIAQDRIAATEGPVLLVQGIG
jgi:hypothetical protein